MWPKWGKCIKYQCAILLVFSGMAHFLNLRMLIQMGTDGLLWGTVQLPGFLNGIVDGFAVFTVLFCRALRAHVVAVFVVI